MWRLIPELMIRITADIPKHLISTIVSENIDESLANESLEYNGFDVKIKRNGALNITARKKSIYLDLPLDIHIEKPNGLFSIEANGSILLNVTVTTHISEALDLSTKTTIDGWKWIIEPKVKVGILNIPVSPLANLVMNRMDDSITSQIDQAVSEKVDFQHLINKKLANLIDSKRIVQDPELYLRAQLEGLDSPGFREYTDKIELPLYLHIKNQITTEYQVSSDWDVPPFQWIDNDPLEYQQDVNISLKYDKLEELVRSKIDGLVIGGKTLKSDKVEISFSDQLHLKVNIISPIESNLTVTGRPEIEDGKIHLKDLDVDMQTPSLIYKMTAPIIEKLIRDDIDDRLPINIEEILIGQIRHGLAIANKIPYLDLKVDANLIAISDIQFTESHLEAKILAKEVEVAIALEHLKDHINL